MLQNYPAEMWLIAGLVLMVCGWLANWFLSLFKMRPMQQALMCLSIGGVLLLGFIASHEYLWLMPVIGMALGMFKQFDDSL